MSNVESKLISPYVYAGIKPIHLPEDIQDRLKIKVFNYKREYVVDAIEQILGITEQELVSKHRKREKCDARHMYCNIMRNKLRWYLDDIGETIGGRDHTTVINSVEKHKILVETVPYYKEAYKKIERYVDLMSAD